MLDNNQYPFIPAIEKGGLGHTTLALQNWTGCKGPSITNSLNILDNSPFCFSKLICTSSFLKRPSSPSLSISATVFGLFLSAVAVLIDSWMLSQSSLALLEVNVKTLATGSCVGSWETKTLIITFGFVGGVAWRPFV